MRHFPTLSFPSWVTTFGRPHQQARSSSHLAAVPVRATPPLPTRGMHAPGGLR